MAKSLTACIQRVGAKLDPADKARVLARARELRSGGATATESAVQATKDAIGEIRDGLKASAPKAASQQNPQKKHPKTVMGSELLAIVSERLGGLDPSLLSEYSVYVPTGKLDKAGKPRMAWRNPPIPGIGLLFRRGGRQDRQEIAQVLEDADYLEPGAVASDYKEAGERAKELIKAALDRNIPKTLAEQQAELEADREAERKAYYDALDEESAIEADAERAAIMAEASIARVELQAADDDVLWDVAGSSDTESQMRALGFSEQEIQDELARESQAQAPVRGEDAEAAGPAAPEAGPAGVDAAQPGPEQAAEGLTLEAPTPAGLKAKATREQAAADADAKEQKRLERKAKADAEAPEFTLTGSDRPADVAAAAGQGDIFDQPAEPAAPAEDEAPQLTEAQARKQFEWRNMGQSGGTKTHRLFFFATPAEKGTSSAMGRGYVELYEGSSGWRVDGEGQSYKSLSEAKAAAIEAAIPVLREQGWIVPLAAEPSSPFAGNKVFTQSDVDAARALLKKKLNQLNSGIDPELMQAGITIAGAYIESGVRKFADFARVMVDDLGERVKPYLKSFYNAIRDYPNFDAAGMDPYESVSRTDLEVVLRERQDAGLGQPTPDRVSVVARLFADLPQRQALVEQGFDRLDVSDQRSVLTQVSSRLQDSEVLQAVVEAVPIDVVNVLIGRQLSAKALLDQPSMLAHGLSVALDAPVPGRAAGVIDSLVAKLRDEGALSAAKGSAAGKDFGGSAPSGSAAAKASDDRHNVDGTAVRANPQSSAAGKVENFGEALPPARRAMAAKLDESLTDSDIANRPLSEIWPLAENEAIEDTFAAAVAHAARAEVPAKPRVAYKLRQWVEKVKTVRGLAAHVVSGRLTRERLRDEGGYTLRDWVSKVFLLEQLPRDQWKRIGTVEERPDSFNYKDGKQIPSPMLRLTVDDKSHWLGGDGTVDGNLAEIRALLGNAAPEKRMEFEIRGPNGGPYKINKKGDSKYRPLMTFKTTAEARKAIEDDYASLVAAWEAVKDRDNITERDLRTAENRPRAGKDWRNGKDVTPEQFQEAFGFRGGEFGKWVSQGKGDKERQAIINSAYDALMDLAQIAGVPPRAISLNGTLGIAFGARGSGWASAHFEPSNLVINLTKTRGAGALAHEWFHALDNYFSRMRRDGAEAPYTGSQTQYRDDNYITHRPEALMVRKDRSRRFQPMTKGALDARHEAQKHLTDAYGADKWERDPTNPSAVRPEVEQRFAALVLVLNESPMTKRAALLDDGNGYWSRTLERAARAFEGYVIARMHEDGYHNDFLVNVRKSEETGKTAAHYPYLLPGEIKPVAEAFGALFDTIQTRTDDAGNVALLSQRPTKSAYDEAFQRAVRGEATADDRRTIQSRPGYGDYAATALARNVDASRALRGELEAAFGRWGGPSLDGQRGAIAAQATWLRAASDADLKRLTDAADRFDAPIIVRGQESQDNLAFVGRMRAAGFETHVGMFENGSRQTRDVVISMVRPGGGITARTPLASQSPGRGVPLSTLKPHIDAITAKMPGLRNTVQVVGTVTDLPKGIVDSLRSMNALGTVRGLRMPDGRVFLVADKLDSQLEAEFVLFHEVFGHEGLRAILTGDEYARAMTLVRLSNKKVAAEADAWMASYGAGQIAARVEAGMTPEAARREVRLLAIEEALADRAGKNDPPAVWKNVMAILQKALRRLGMDDLANWLENRTEAETYSLLIQARKAITEGKVHALRQVPEGMAAMSRRFSSLRNMRPTASYVDATPRQRATLDQIDEGPESTDFDLLPAKEALSVSADSHFTDWEQERGIKYVPLEMLGPLTGYNNAKDTARIRRLADAIQSSNTFEPIFVGIDPNGEAYIMEGQHRARALAVLGQTHVPAQVIVSMEGDEADYAAQPDEPRRGPTDYRSAAGQAPLFSRRDAPSATAPAVTVQPDENGNPTFRGAAVKLDYPQPAERFEFIPGPGQQLLNYAIMPTEGFDSLGFVELVVENGQVTALMDIEVNGAGRRAGVGKQVIETILAANPQADVNISNIVHQARGFWEKMGVPAQNLEDGAAYDGTLNWQTYAEATNDGRTAGVGQGMQGQVRRDDARAAQGNREAGRGAQAPVLSQRSDLQAQAKALGLPAIGTSADLADRIRILESHPSTWTRADFDKIAHNLSIHQDLRPGSADRVDAIMRDGLNKGMVDSLSRMKNGQWTWAQHLKGGDAYAFVDGALKFKSPDSAWLAPGNMPLFHFTTKPGQDLYEAVKSASGDPSNPSILLSQKPARDPITESAMRKAGVRGPQSMGAKVRAYFGKAMEAVRQRSELADAARQGTLDQFYGILRAERRTMGNLPAEQSAYVTARLANGGTSSVMRALMLHGQAKWAGNGQHLEKVDGTKGLLDILKPLGEDLNDFFGWMVGNRAARLLQEGRENNLSAEEIKALQALADTPEKKAAFIKSAGEYAAFKRSVLDVAEGAGLIDREGRKAWDHADYIPFYREIDDKGTFGATGKKGLAGQSSGIRMLKGGESELNDPMENLLMNFSRLIDASLKNNAIRKTIDTLQDAGSTLVKKVGYDMKSALVPREQVRKMLIEAGTPESVVASMPDAVFDGMAKMWAIQAPTDPTVVRVMRDGKPQFYKVNDHLLLSALTSFVPFDFPGLSVMRAAKRLLTATVTATPEFMIRNWIRDSMASQAITQSAFNPLESIKGIARSYKEQGGYEAMLFAGSSFQSGNVNAGSPESTAIHLRRALRERGMDASSVESFMGSIIDNTAAGWEKYRQVGEAIENANREAVYEGALKAGKSATDAAFEAKDLMDFSLRGSWAGYQILADVLPFFNARVQGLYRMGRADPKRLAIVGSMMLAATLLLALANAGEEWYEELEDWDKDAYWHFKVNGMHFRVPKPFEVGVIFATIPERIGRYLLNFEVPRQAASAAKVGMGRAPLQEGDGADTGKKTLGRVYANIRDQLAFDPMPQLFRPAVDAWANKDSFRDRDIEGMGDEGKPVHARYNERTSDTMRVIADKAAPVTDAFGLSPKKMEFLLGGYFGTAGLYALALSDMAVRKIEGRPVRPESRMDDLPVVRAFYREDPARSTIFASEVYKMHREVEQIVREYNALRKSENPADEAKAELVREKHEAKIEARGTIMRATKIMGRINKQMASIYNNTAMSAAAKREAIDALQIEKNAAAKEAATDKDVRAAF